MKNKYKKNKMCIFNFSELFFILLLFLLSLTTFTSSWYKSRTIFLTFSLFLFNYTLKKRKYNKRIKEQRRTMIGTKMINVTIINSVLIYFIDWILIHM